MIGLLVVAVVVAVVAVVVMVAVVAVVVVSLAYFSHSCTLINREAVWINRERAGYKNKAKRRIELGLKVLSQGVVHDHLLSDCSMYHHIFSYKCPVCRSTLFLLSAPMTVLLWR